MKYYTLRKIGKSFVNLSCSFIPNEHLRRVFRNKYSPLGADSIAKYFAKHYLPSVDVRKSYKKSLKQEYIFQAWFQGMENAPAIIKKCMASVDKFKGSRKHIILTDKNLFDWVELPDYIMKKYKAGIIDKAHFADIVRVVVLAKWGGYWIDATCMITGDFDKKIESADFFMFHSDSSTFYTLIQNCFIKSRTGHPLICAWRDVMFEYWKKENFVVHYFFNHFLFLSLVKYNDVAKFWYEKMPVIYQAPTHAIQCALYEKFDADDFKKILKNSFIHKLRYTFDKKKIKIDFDGSYLQFILDNDLDYILKFSPR